MVYLYQCTITPVRLTKIKLNQVGPARMTVISRVQLKRCSAAMKSIANLFHSISVQPPAELNNARKPVPQKKPVDCLFIVGPDMQGTFNDYESQARRHGLKWAMIGDGKVDITRDMIDQARRSGVIGSDTQVICQLHGRIKTADGSAMHQVQLRDCADVPGLSNPRNVDTRELIRWLREPLLRDHVHDTPVEAWSGNVHLLSCKVGEVRKDKVALDRIKSAEPTHSDFLSRHCEIQGNVILYGGNKNLLATSAKSNLRSLFSYLGEYKRQQGVLPEASLMFDRIKSESMDTVVLLGSDLRQTNIAKAPKNLFQIFPEHDFALQRQHRANEQLGLAHSNYSTSQKISAETKKSLWNTLSKKSKEKATHYLQVRMNHLKTEKKLAQLKDDLHVAPELTNVTIGSLTPLMLLAIRKHSYRNQTVKNSDIARVLIEAGADTLARDLSGKTAAHHAAKTGAAGVLKEIYENPRSVRADGKRPVIDARDYSGATVACYAARSGNYRALEVLLDKQAQMTGVDASGLSTLLHQACKAEHDRFATVKAILRKGARTLINKRDLSGKTALHIAVMAGDADTVQALLGAGANPGQRTLGFSTPSELARSLGGERGEKIQALLRNAKAKKAL
jgi:ankyrin repeat protein